MKKALLALMCLVAMMAAGTSLKAQEVTIVLNPGWNWISYPSTDTMDIATVFGSFTPEVGDIFKSKWGMTTYIGNGQWRGSLSPVFYPGYGYHYKSNRQMPVVVTFNVQQPAPQVVVTTSEPTDITPNSATCGGNVASSSGDYVFVFLKGICWSTSPNPTFNDNYIEAGNGLGSFTVSMTELTSGSTYYVRAFAVTPTGTFYGEELSFATNTDHEYVDLGLPSGLLWATCNLGAETPEDYGDYFAWGETQPKDTYFWNNYQYNGFGGLTKYTGYDGLTTLLPEDDAVTANWGSSWRMPTEGEWQELYDNTTHTWTTQNGVSGTLFTASNGSTLFIPHGGLYYENMLDEVGYNGYYWSSSLGFGDPSYAVEKILMMEVPGLVGPSLPFDGNRYVGMSVRAVRRKNSVVNVIINSTEGGSVSGGGTYFDGTICTVSATANEGYTFICWSENGEMVSSEVTYSFTVSGNRSLVAFFYNYVSGACQYVDLDLPSGILWATCNVGAETPEGYGNYFAWGETQPKSVYSWNTYQYCNGNYNTLMKYCSYSGYGYNGFTDNLTTLQPEDDAATANWGSNWRTPTKEEWQELCDNATYTKATLNGVKGRLFTATNGNSLFLPAAGYCENGSLSSVGLYGSYWSSSLNVNVPYYAWRLYFFSGINEYEYKSGSNDRRCGNPVRAVCSVPY